MRRFIEAVVLAVTLSLGVGACGVISGQKTTGEAVDDATISTRVKTRFAKDPDVAATRINVDTMKGVVQLTGFAKSAAEKQKAVSLARTVPGVTDVVDNIQVETASSDK